MCSADTLVLDLLALPDLRGGVPERSLAGTSGGLAELFLEGSFPECFILEGLER